MTTERPGQTLIADRHHYGRDFERALADAGVDLLRPARKGEPERPDARLFKPLRRTIESIKDLQGTARPGTARRTHPHRG